MEGYLTHVEMFVFFIVFSGVILRACMYDQETANKNKKEN